jgi:hypothetical protein
VSDSLAKRGLTPSFSSLASFTSLAHHSDVASILYLCACDLYLIPDCSISYFLFKNLCSCQIKLNFNRVYRPY